MSIQQQPKGCRIGILGGGQLGMLSAQAAKQLGYQTLVWAQSPEEPATKVADKIILGDFNDRTTLENFIKACDVATLEFENVPVHVVGVIEDRMPMYPGSKVLRIASDRLAEKKFLAACKVPIGPLLPVITREQAEDLSRYQDFTFPAILKTARLGYDGHGQRTINSPEEILPAYLSFKQASCVLEARLNFVCELSVIVARSTSGTVRTFPAIENRHQAGILRQSQWPSMVFGSDVDRKARKLARFIANELGVVGLLAVEMFLLEDETLLVNELAPRPHNSGHGTIDACSASQFTQHIRAICGAPLRSTRPHSEWLMENLIGLARDQVPSDPSATLYWYGKPEARPGRKMGHRTWVTPR